MGSATFGNGKGWLANGEGSVASPAPVNASNPSTQSAPWCSKLQCVLISSVKTGIPFISSPASLQHTMGVQTEAFSLPSQPHL